MSNPIACLRDLTFSYGGRLVLNGLDLTLGNGEVAAITGPSGSGKSTLLSLVLGLLKPDRGEVRVNGRTVQFGNNSAAAKMRRETIGMVFQAGYLLDELTPLENVILPALAGGIAFEAAASKGRVLLAQLGIEVQARQTSSLSGGEQQRVAIARALIGSPRLLIADEPTASLDRANRENVISCLCQQVRGANRALLLVTHDEDIAASADRWYHLDEGRLRQACS
ncbi:Lipoprotein-releasing system ATP-binding protein LolD [Actinomyces bovis]|uniref:Lipoprotein-releasing system ATP-binding protein LolD n=1 Tax=Actinomyces bovis TaxID=1658 RepID=A0ABY1VPM5_9ACTO|nr:ATP-binding cassette domain-containing protein [Actinomyces bovis]SPT53874.1 Lipoprotein-releasing system ATP-binding protein LolD [Actinomyces bovis]VEG53294.1 Lipoprotein-releasing system ATP-binding protein LolD [Actinomyces israelii]